MTIQDRDIELCKDFSLVGPCPAGNRTAYHFGDTPYDMLGDQNLVRDIGMGAELYVEFEVTEAFTGWNSILQSPYVTFAVAMGNVFTAGVQGFNGTNWAIVSTAGWSVGTIGAEVGMVPSDAGGIPNGFEGDRFYARINPGVLGSPLVFTGGIPARANSVPAYRYIAACFIMQARTNQANSVLNPGIYTNDDLVTGKVTARIVDRVYHGGSGVGTHIYAAGMKAQ